MRFLAALPLALLLAACAFGPDTSTPRGQCIAGAEDDPTVKDLRMRVLGGSNTAQRELQPDLDDARDAAITRCLRARGLAPPGGVEKPYRVQ